MKANHTFLLIDDNAIDQIVTSQLLKKVLGIDEINIVNNGKEGLDWIGCRNLSDKPLIILLDMRMPEMGGVEFLARFEAFEEERKKNTQIFMLSATLDTREIEQVESNKYVTSFLTKPFPISEFLAIISPDAMA